MKRSFLTGLGITDSEVIKQIIDYHQGVVTDYKEEIANHKLEVSDAKRELKDALENAGADDYKAKYEAEVAEHAKTKESHEAEKTAELTDKEVSELLKASGMNEKVIPKALKMYDRTVAERGKDGKIKNPEKIVEHFKGEWDGFFGEVKTAGADVADPPAGSFGGGNTPTPLSQEIKTLNEHRITS